MKKLLLLFSLLMALSASAQTNTNCIAYVDYTFTGSGYDNIDDTHPFGTECGFQWDNVARQTRAAGKSFYWAMMTTGNVLRASLVNTTNLVNGAVTYEKLSTQVQGLFGTSNATITATITNAATLYFGPVPETDYAKKDL